MFDWLFDGFWVVTLGLGSAGVACAVGWWKTDWKRGGKYYAIAFAVVAVLFGTYIVLHFLYETASEQMERRIQEIANSVRSKQITTVLDKNLADSFHVGSFDKRRFIDRAQALADQHHVDSVGVSGIHVVSIDRDKRTATVSFFARATASEGEALYRVQAEFVMTPKAHWWDKEEWKMRSFRYFHAFGDTETELPIP